MITNDGWFDFARRMPGPPDKVYSQPCDATMFLPHDAVGYLDGWLSRLFSTARLPNGRYTPYAAASVTGIILDEIEPATGDAVAIQHYSIFKSCWASGSAVPNTKGNAWEHERIRGNFSSLDMPPHMVRTSARICRELAAFRGWSPRRPNAPVDTTATCYEHRECIRFGSAATACPSGRADKIWAEIFAPDERAGDYPMIIHDRDLRWGDQAGGWVNRSFGGPRTYRPNGRADASLPANARMMRLHVRFKPGDGWIAAYGHGPGGFAGMFRGDTLIGNVDVVLAADGTYELTNPSGVPFTFESAKCVGYWI